MILKIIFRHTILLLRSKNGASIIQLLIIIALLGASISITVFQNSQTSKKVSHNIYNQDLKLFTDRIQSVLANQLDCTDIINGTTGFSTLQVGSSIAPQSLTGSKLGTFLLTTDINTTQLPRYGSQNKISLLQITLERTSLTKGNITLNFRIEDNVLGIREFFKQVNLIFIGTTNSVTACHANPSNMVSESIKRFCHGPGAVYNADTDQCYIIGIENIDCNTSKGEYIKGLTFNPSKMMVFPICDSIFSSSFSYDTEGCFNSSQVPTGFGSDGKLVCTTMTPSYILNLIQPNQKNLASEECHSSNARLNSNTGFLKIDCEATTPTPTPTNTPSGATPTPTSTSISTSTPTSTPTPTSSTPSPTATNCGVTNGLVGNVLPKTGQSYLLRPSLYYAQGCGSLTYGFADHIIGYFGPSSETDVDTDTIFWGNNNASNIPELPYTTYVKLCGSYLENTICSCDFYTVSNVNTNIGFQVTGDTTSPYRSDFELESSTITKVTKYNIANCNLSKDLGRCRARRVNSYSCVSNGINASNNSWVLKRVLHNGIQKPEVNGSYYNVCASPGEQSNWTIGIYSESYFCGFHDYNWGACQINPSCGVETYDTTCTCSSGGISVGKGFVYDNVSYGYRTMEGFFLNIFRPSLFPFTYTINSWSD